VCSPEHVADRSADRSAGEAKKVRDHTKELASTERTQQRKYEAYTAALAECERTVVGSNQWPSDDRSGAASRTLIEPERLERDSATTQALLRLSGSDLVWTRYQAWFSGFKELVIAAMNGHASRGRGPAVLAAEASRVEGALARHAELYEALAGAMASEVRSKSRSRQAVAA